MFQSRHHLKLRRACIQAAIEHVKHPGLTAVAGLAVCCSRMLHHNNATHDLLADGLRDEDDL